MSTETTTQSLKPGSLLQSSQHTYKILKVLGAGSFGITYLASAKVPVGNIQQTCKFAIKEHFMNACYRGEDDCMVFCTPSAKKEVEASRADFIVEAKRLEKLCRKSKNIVNVNETFEANGTAYYVMEYLEGGNPSKCSESEAVNLLIPLAEAVGIIHKEHVLHLDIKPDNIVMKRDEDGKLFPVLIDFGVSKHFNSNGKPTSMLTAKGASEGYAPQEQYGNINEFSPKLDVYALGGLLFYLLTGSNPPNAFKVMPDQKEISRAIPASTSDMVRNALLHAMNPNINSRTSDTSSFIEDLGKSCSTGTGTTVLDRDADFDKLKKYLTWGVAGIAVVLAVVFGIKLFGGHGSSGTQPAPSALALAIANRDEAALKSFAEKDSASAFLPYAQLLFDKGETEAAKVYASKALATNDSTNARYLLTAINGNSAQGTAQGANNTAADDNKPNTPSATTPAAQTAPAAASATTASASQQTAAPAAQTEQKPTSGTLSLEGGTWRGGVKNGKANGNGTISFGSGTSFHGTAVEAGYSFRGEYENGRLVHGALYDANGAKIKTIIP